MSYSEILFPLGANGTTLTVDNTNLRGIGWVPGGGGGGINAVNPGNNIDVATVAGVATVSLENPLTAPLNIGTQPMTGVVAITHDIGATPLTISNANANQNVVLNTNGGIVLSNSALQVPAIRDAGGLTGVANQVLSAGPGGGSLVWVAQGGGGGGITAVNAGNNIDVATVGTVATVSLKAPLTTNLDMGAVDITTSTVNGQIEMVLNGDGRFVVSQNSAGGDNIPALTIQNQNANANEVHIDIYKNSASPAVNDGIGAISFHANNSGGVKQQFAYIQANCIDPTAGSPNASISMYSCVNNTVPSEYLRLSGSSDRVESYKNIDMVGVSPVIMGSTCGNLSLNTSSSSGAGSITVQSKGILQMTAPTSLFANTTGFSLTATQQSVISSPIQILSGSVSTLNLEMIYRATLQPDLTASPYVVNPALFDANGQGITLINNSGNGSNDLQSVQTIGFSIHTQTFSTLFFGGNGGFLVSGYNTYNLTAEIRMGATMANILSNDTNQYIYIILGVSAQANANFCNAVWFNDAHQPDIAIFGGSFVIGAGGNTGNGPVSNFPSNVSNILVINTALANGQIFPYDMNASGGFYGFNGVVRCFSQIPLSGVMIYGSPNQELYVAVGGDFLDTIPSQGAGNELAGIAKIRIDNIGNSQFNIGYLYGLITFFLPFDYISFLGVSTAVGSQDANSYLVAGGNFTAGGGGLGWNGEYLIATSWNYWDTGQGAWATSFFVNEPLYNTPGSFITAGAPANPSATVNLEWIFSIFNTTTQLFDTIKKYIDIQFTSTNTNIIQQGHPSGVFSYAMEIGNLYPLSLKYAIGGSFKYGQTPFVYEFANSSYLNLGGIINFGNCSRQISTTGDWWFFRDPETAGNPGIDNYTEEIPNNIVAIVINTTSAMPFVNYLTPTIFNETITLSSTNNFALGTYVGHNTNDRRILIHTHNGAFFTN